MEGFVVIEYRYCGAKPALLLRRGDEWCVYRSGPVFYSNEDAARRCLECMIEHRHQRCRKWTCPNEQQT